MNAGRLIASGSPKQLKAEHITYSILEVETAAPVAAMDLLRNQPWVIETSLFGTYLHVGVDDPGRRRESVRSILTSNNIQVQRIDQIVPSLEDVFLHLLEKDMKKRAA
jgi:ABC-2 type transport system ATP-binding protein